MRTRYKYIHFKQIGNPAGELKWSCRNNRSLVELGEVRWYKDWKKWCYFPTARAVYSDDCLADIWYFLGQLAEAFKGGKAPGGAIQPQLFE